MRILSQDKASIRFIENESINIWAECYDEVEEFWYDNPQHTENERIYYHVGELGMYTTLEKAKEVLIQIIEFDDTKKSYFTMPNDNIPNGTEKYYKVFV